MSVKPDPTRDLTRERFGPLPTRERHPTGRQPRIAAVPMWYRDTLFRSTLEADWAATFDEFGWGWTYEPMAIRVNGGAPYLCDFHLPAMDVWAEVKGPHDERIDKVRALARELDDDSDDLRKALVVILRAAGPGNCATWEAPLPGMDIVIAHCPSCDTLGLLDTGGIWLCRRCYYGQSPGHDGKFWRKEYYTSGSLAFQRAPRPSRT